MKSISVVVGTINDSDIFCFSCSTHYFPQRNSILLDFILTFSQILAIYDEQSPNGSDAVDSCSAATAVPRGPVVGRVRDSVVEIVSLDNPPSECFRSPFSPAEVAILFANRSEFHSEANPTNTIPQTLSQVATLMLWRQSSIFCPKKILHDFL